MNDLITSRENPHIKQLCALLSQKKQRDETGLFVLEGARLCLDAATAQLPGELLLLTQQAVQRYPKIEALIEQYPALWISESLAERVGDTKSPQGVFLIAKKCNNTAESVVVQSNGRYLIAAGLQDPGNLGMILRTAQALGIDGAMLSGCPDLYGSKVVRAAMGAHWHLPIALYDDPINMVKSVEAAGVTVFAAALGDSAIPVCTAKLGEGCAVLIGNEGAGLSDTLVKASTKQVEISMCGGANSLNAAAAATILLWEMARG